MSKKKTLDEVLENEEIIEEDIEPIVIKSEEELDETQKKIDEYKDIAQRLQAEFDNYRKRNNESVKNARNDGINDVIIALFPVLDNLERGIGAVSEETAKSGMELIHKQIVSLLGKFDVTEIDAVGKDFDPKFHHAIAQCEDEERSNTVVEVYQKGYQRKDKVLRPSMVKVAQ